MAERFKLYIPINELTSPDRFDGNTIIAEYTSEDGSIARIIVWGDFDVTDRRTGKRYRNPSELPDGWKKYFTDKSGHWEENPDIEFTSGSSFILFRDGCDTNDDDEVFTDLSKMTKEEMQHMMADYLKRLEGQEA